ncbi:MAG: MFS transporter [Armatimonadota bacterium]
MRGWLVLIASVAMMLCLGGIYAWSVFVTPLRLQFGLTAAQTQLIFGLAIAVFTSTMVLAGRLLERWGPAPVAAVGGALYGGGYLLASVSGGKFALLLPGIGLLSGAGTGCCYVSALSSCVRWFPSIRGLVTGIAVAGFGGGAIGCTILAGRLMEHSGDVLNVFRLIGLMYGGVVFLSALALSFPQGSARSDGGVLPLRDVLRQRQFWSLAIGMFCGTFSGLMVVGNIQPIGLTAGLEAGAAGLAVMTLAAGNTVGRIVWGTVHDRIGRASIAASLLALCLALLLVLPSASSKLLFAAAASLVGFGFGACFVVYAAQVARDYGPSGIGQVYPVIFLFYGLSGLAGPPVGGAVFDRTGSYGAAIAIAVAVTALGLVLSTILGTRKATRPEHDRAGVGLSSALTE